MLKLNEMKTYAIQIMLVSKKTFCLDTKQETFYIVILRCIVTQADWCQVCAFKTFRKCVNSRTVGIKGFWTSRPSSIPSLSHPVPFFQPRSTRPRTTRPSLFVNLSLTIYFTSHVGARTHNPCIVNHYRYHYTSGSVASQPVNVL